MPDVSFEDPAYQRTHATKESFSLSGVIQRMGLASSTQGAQAVLVGIAVAMFAIAGWVYYASSFHMPSKSELRAIKPEGEALKPR